jgi:hypothetical protein
MAQSCLAPGFSTLVSNLVIISSPDLNEGKKQTCQTIIKFSDFLLSPAAANVARIPETISG